MTHRLIPGLPDDVALSVLVKLPRALHGKLRAVCCSWRSALHPQGAVVALWKTLGITDCWLAIVSVTCGRVQCEFFDPILGAAMKPASQPFLAYPSYCQQGCRVCLTYQKSPIAVGHKIFLPSFSTLAFETLRCLDAETMQWGENLHLMPLGHPNHSAYGLYAASAEANKQAFYVAGGKLANGRGLKGAGRVDIETGTWEALPELHKKRFDASAVTRHGRFCVLGGFGPDTRGDCVQSGEEWDPINRRWMLTPELWPVRPLGERWGQKPCVAVLRDKLYAVLQPTCAEPYEQELFYYGEATKLWISMGSFCISALLLEAYSGCYVSREMALFFKCPLLKMAATAEELLLISVLDDDYEGCRRLFVLSTNPTNLSKPISWKVSVLPLSGLLLMTGFHALTVHVA